MRGPETLYVEPTNRCNLRCTTCPRTYFSQEPSRDMSLDEFGHILSQVPDAKRVVLHGLGEPLLHPDIHQFVERASSQADKVLFNTNGLLLTEGLAEKLINAGLDELRISVDMPLEELYPEVRPGGSLGRIWDGVKAVNRVKTLAGSRKPAVSFWMTEGRERIGHLEQLIREAARLDVGEVYLQRLILMDAGDAVKSKSVYRNLEPSESAMLRQAEATARTLGVKLWGSGDADPVVRDEEEGAARPWQKCTRPFNAAYVSVHGTMLPCCLSPFTAAGKLDDCILGNIFEQSFEAIWSGPVYQEFRRRFASDEPPVSCAGCGTQWSL
jgi:MoaA/NifB/PqqE/SkfB family radical SAM enzyme